MRRCSVAKRRALALLLCLLLLLCTACGGQAQEDAGALHCTVRIECSTVLAHMDDLKAGKADIVPSDGVLLPETTVAFSDGDTVFDVLQRVKHRVALRKGDHRLRQEHTVGRDKLRLAGAQIVHVPEHRAAFDRHRAVQRAVTVRLRTAGST